MTANREGFSLVELLISLLILAVGIMAMATVLGYLTVQVRTAEARTERALAVEQVQEQLRGTSFNALASRPRDQAESIGEYDVWWSVEPEGGNLVRVVIYSEGPGLEGSGWALSVPDSSSTSMARIGS